MTSAKEIVGTDAFIDLAIRTKMCQKTTTLSQCSALNYLRIGTEQCKCRPFELRAFSEETVFFRLYYKNCSVLSQLVFRFLSLFVTQQDKTVSKRLQMHLKTAFYLVKACMQMLNMLQKHPTYWRKKKDLKSFYKNMKTTPGDSTRKLSCLLH